MFILDNLRPTGSSLSVYARNLPAENPNVKKRYIEKIAIIGFNDPYATSIRKPELPSTVTTGHVVEYLLNFRSPYTGNPMKNNRSLEGYTKFESGFVHSVTGQVMHGHYVVKGKMVHSMRLNEQMLNPWIIVGQNGNIVSAHCDCIAGCSETCSHVSAVLYFLADLHSTSAERKPTVTDVPAYWRQPPKRIREDLYKTVDEVEYGKVTKRHYDRPPPRTRDDFYGLLEDIKSDGGNAVILHSQCDSTHFLCQQCEDGTIPDGVFVNRNIFLQKCFDAVYEDKSLDELREVGRRLFFQLRKDEVDYIENHTRQQANCDLWRFVRIGRITASILKRVVNTSNVVPPPKKSLLKNICHPYDHKVDTPAMAYGRRHEPIAKSHLAKAWAAGHVDGVISDCGIFLGKTGSFMAASPDAVGSCTCCGRFSVEIKCPYRLAKNTPLNSQLTFTNLAETPHSFLKKVGDTYQLNEQHDFYYQVQAQIFLSDSDFGLFVVWSKEENVVIRVEKNQDFWNQCVQRSQLYFYNIVMPELLCNFYTKNGENKH